MFRNEEEEEKEKVNDPIKQFILGWKYETGDGVSIDNKKAVDYYTLAADQGYDQAQCNLGLCYEKGRGVKRKLTKAVELYSQAADKGHHIAQSKLGWCYENGIGVEKDETKAGNTITRQLSKTMLELNAILVCATRMAVDVRRMNQKQLSSFEIR
jgi:hypothetical protein